MADEVRIDVQGDKKLKRQLRRLSSKGARKALRAGANKAVSIIKKAVKQGVPGDAKSIKKAIGSEVKVNKQVGVLARVGINLKKKKGRGYVFYGAMYIRGTVKRRTKTTGANRGQVQPNPVVQRGYKKSEDQAGRGMRDKMGEVIRKEAGK